MMVRMVLLLVAALVSTNAFAGGLEQLCAAGGYYSGAQAGFMNELANYILQEHEDMKNTKCKTLWQAAYEVGERISKKGQLKPADSAILDNVSAFRKRVYLSIAKGAGY